MALFKLLSAAKLPLVVAVLGLGLNVTGPNNVLRNTGAAIAWAGFGGAAIAATGKNKGLAEVRALSARCEREKVALQTAADGALADVAAAQLARDRHIAQLHLSQDQVSRLELALTTLKAERDWLQSEAKVSAAKVSTCHDDNSLIAGQLETLEIERVQLIAELYETAVEEVEIKGAIAGMESQFENRSAYELTQRKKLKTEITKARADLHTQLSEAQERIEELEGSLAEKTQLATQMIDEINGEANGKLTQIGGKMGSQSEVIKALQMQLDEARKTNKALTLRRFDTVGTDNTHGNRLIDALAKRGSIYGAFDVEREGNNGRLKVRLTLVDAPLKRAQDCLEDLEAELNLWAKPSVKVDRGMHLFTLATEQEHKVLAAPNVPLTRLEKTLDNAIHARIVGQSGSGKSVLLNNLMHYMAATMKGAKVTLLDPKAVDDWGTFTPRYWGEECVTGIVDLANDLKGRVANTVKARKAGKPSPDYAPELFIVDEAQYNYLLAQNADDSHVKKRGEQAPNYAKKAKGALAGLLSLGRAYNAIGLFVTQLPQVSKVGLNEGSFDPCVNIFLGKQIDNAISSFLPGCGYSDSKCKVLEKEAATRRKLGQRWIMLVADLPRSEAYLMECPAPGYYHNRFSGDLEGFADSVKSGEKLRTVDTTETQSGDKMAVGETSPAVTSDITTPPTTQKQPAAHCPKCKHKSIKLNNAKPKPNGKYRFVCENDACKSKTFSAAPLA